MTLSARRTCFELSSSPASGGPLKVAVNMGPIHPSLALPALLSVGIPPRDSHILSLLFTTSYVGSLYVARLLLPTKKSARPSSSPNPGLPPIAATDSDAQVPMQRRAGPEVGSRDHPDTIRLRMRAVGIATVASLGGVWYVVRQASGLSFRSAVSASQRVGTGKRRADVRFNLHSLCSVCRLRCMA